MFPVHTLRLAGLRVHSNLRAGSPDKARQRRLRERCRGEASAWLFPGGAALTGLRVHSNLRTGSPDKARQRRLRENDRREA
ncbi:hypothetical protein OGU21_09010 [Klebsiella oxytoca]|uniref:hypothetical protein n=1 Tax=Klebsiella oxytoca TaxID=571 RepID=UPI0022B78C3F|nr:hypothetical protein [Klebsiella oxytoca]EIY2868249.1 hypothetical protein [Klebsiella oxytoca]EKQ7193992.1 hypothetical protein [Klebsiella oxytoca]WBD84794.1 hypothetical protein OGU21_09010 [Klebsiella oxytoca]HDX8807784.1 hypothetical protein [Klebsiella oxytoca]HDX8950253.1 hypothetical protein [Klebsiella oxytoca]